jgi:hypothetical protein
MARIIFYLIVFSLVLKHSPKTFAQQAHVNEFEIAPRAFLNELGSSILQEQETVDLGRCDCETEDYRGFRFIFGEVEFMKYGRISAGEVISKCPIHHNGAISEVDGFSVCANQPGGRIYQLITYRNCAESWKLKIYNSDDVVIFSETYKVEELTASGVLERPGFENFFSFKIDLTGKQYADCSSNGNYYTIVIESYDSEGLVCATVKSPYIIFSCPN